MNRRKMVPPSLFSSLSADTEFSRERLKLVRLLNSLYLAHFILSYLLSSSPSCHSLRLSKNKCQCHQEAEIIPGCILIHPGLSAVCFQMPSPAHFVSDLQKTLFITCIVTPLETLSISDNKPCRVYTRGYASVNHRLPFAQHQCCQACSNTYRLGGRRKNNLQTSDNYPQRLHSFCFFLG